MQVGGVNLPQSPGNAVGGHAAGDGAADAARGEKRDSASSVAKSSGEKRTEKPAAGGKSGDKADQAETDGTTLSFKIHKGTGEIMVQVIDNDTGKVLREIPPEKILDTIAEIWKNAGINVDRKV